MAGLLLATRVCGVCVGDCDGDSTVTIDELVRGVVFALAGAAPDGCGSLDSSGDGQITVDEIVFAVRNALEGCFPISTPTMAPSTPTLTPTPTPEVSATPTGGRPVSPATRSVGLLLGSTTIMRAIPTLFGAVLGHIPPRGGGDAAPGPGFEITSPCSGGGSVTLSCDQPLVPPPGSPAFRIVFSNCLDLANGGVFLTLNGAVDVTGQPGDSCTELPNDAALGIDSLSLRIESDHGVADSEVSGIRARLGLACRAEPCACFYDRMDLDFRGTVAATFRDLEGVRTTSSVAHFANGSRIGVDISQYDEYGRCEPTIFSTGVTADVAVDTDGRSAAVEFTDFVQEDDSTSGEDLLSVHGVVTSPCLGGEVRLVGRTPLRLNRGAACPSSGEVAVDSGTSVDLVRYGEEDVTIDLGADGSVEDTLFSCADPRALACTP